MIDEKRTRRYCREDISLIENYDKAINDETQTWHCHHRDEVKILPSGMVARRYIEELKENERYYYCPANELIFLTNAEHRTLHNKVISFSEETKRKMSESHKGNSSGSGNKGKIRSDFSKKFTEHYGFTNYENPKLYHREIMWFLNHNKTCRWEKEA